MAKIWYISDGRSYVVNGDPGTTITYTNSTVNGTAAGKQAATIPFGATSVIFPSNGSEVEISSDEATIDQVFNAAAAGAGSSSGGSGSVGGITFQVVTTLPAQGETGVIYLVNLPDEGTDVFEKWIWVDSEWESIGKTVLDPATYAKLVGGNEFTGDQVITGSLTVIGATSGAAAANYEVPETTSQVGDTWLRNTGTEIILISTADDGTYTQLYFAGANTPLANTYEGGEAMLGYVTRDSAGNIMTDAEGNAMVGTQKLSALFPNNRGENAFNPADPAMPTAE